MAVAKLDRTFQKEDAGMGSHTGFTIKLRVSSIANPRSIYKSQIIFKTRLNPKYLSFFMSACWLWSTEE